MEEVRLQKFLAECGIASRRKCEEYILEGKVKVNGEVVDKLGDVYKTLPFEVKTSKTSRRKGIYIIK